MSKGKSKGLQDLVRLMPSGFCSACERKLFWKSQLEGLGNSSVNKVIIKHVQGPELETQHSIRVRHGIKCL